jgi:hypothetical protein
MMRLKALCLLLIVLVTGAVAAEAPSSMFLDLVKSGRVHLAIEGTENGNKATLTFTNPGSTPLYVTVQQGETRIVVSTSPEIVLTVNSAQAQRINVPAGKQASVTVAQAGSARLEAGKITMKTDSDGMSVHFDNSRVGAR